MQVLELELIDFKLFQLTPYKRFKYVAENPFTIVLGGNGAGKTSLMKEFVTHPPVMSNFGPEGGKYVKLMRNDSIYELSSFNGKHKNHSFLKDGVELNLSANITTQKELIKEELEVTADSIKLLSGYKKFTEMSPGQLSEMLMKIADIDFEYVQKLFNYSKIKTATHNVLLEEAVASQKNISQALSELKYWEEKDLELAMSELQTIYDKLNNRAYPKADNLAIEVMIDKFNREVEKLGNDNTFLKMKLAGGPERVSNRIVSLKAKNISMENEIQRVKTLMRDVENIKRSLMHYGGVEGCEKLIENNQLLLSVTDFNKNKEIFIKSKIEDLVSKRCQAEELLRELRELNEIEKELIERIGGRPKPQPLILNKLEEACAHFSGIVNAGIGRSFTCTHCSTEFTPEGVSQKEFVEAMEKRNEIEAEIDKLLSINDLYGKLTGLRESKATKEGQMTSLTNTYKCSREEIINTLDSLIFESGKEYEKQKLAVSVQAADSALRNYKSFNLSSDESLDDNSDLSRLLQELEKNKKMVNNLEFFMDRFTHMSEQVTNLEKERKNILRAVNEAHRNESGNFENGMRGDLLREISKMMNLGKDVHNLKDRLNRANESFSSNTDLKESYQLLSKTLSPKTGLIGKHLSVFTAEFLGRLNQLLEEMLDSDLEVRCENTNSLEPRMTLYVNGGKAGDISVASTGQKDAINTAAIITMMEYSKLTDAPLLLDEVGSSFDDTNREKLVTFIRELVDNGSVPHVYLVSHIASMYIGLANVDFIVLDSTNLSTLPKSYNGTVTLEI